MASTPRVAVQLTTFSFYSTLRDTGKLTLSELNAARARGRRMGNRRHFSGRRIVLRKVVGAGIFLCVWLIGCSSPKTAQPVSQSESLTPRRYSLQGRVVSVEKDKQQVVVDHGEITGFMMAMTMGYSVKNPTVLDTLSPEDQITADVVVNGNDVWLENIVILKKADQSKAKAASDSKKK
jgi:Cu/Ag efflux protein CusF